MSYSNRCYQNQGNPDFLAHLQITRGSLLDVGCGAGDNARLIGSSRPDLRIVGITASEQEAMIARQFMDDCVVTDIEQGVPAQLVGSSFDCILFCHVLEHLREPWCILANFDPYLKDGGQYLIALPNIASYRARWELIRGRFPYQASGVFDETHLRFFTYESVDQILLREVHEMELREKTVTGSIPLWILRRYVFPSRLCKVIDKLGCRYFPNLFGDQIILSLFKRSAKEAIRI